METWTLALNERPVHGDQTDLDLTLDYALLHPDHGLGATPDDRRAEIRRQLLEGPLSAGGFRSEEKEDGPGAVAVGLQGSHHLAAGTGMVSGHIEGRAVVAKSGPEAIGQATRSHLAEALATDIAHGLELNIAEQQGVSANTKGVSTLPEINDRGAGHIAQCPKPSDSESELAADGPQTSVLPTLPRAGEPCGPKAAGTAKPHEPMSSTRPKAPLPAPGHKAL